MDPLGVQFEEVDVDKALKEEKKRKKKEKKRLKKVRDHVSSLEKPWFLSSHSVTCPECSWDSVHGVLPAAPPDNLSGTISRCGTKLTSAAAGKETETEGINHRKYSRVVLRSAFQLCPLWKPEEGVCRCLISECGKGCAVKWCVNTNQY